MEDLRVAAVQMCSPVGRVEENLQKMREFVLQARAQDVDIICFPELCIPGYWSDKNLYDLAESIPGRISEKVVGMAEETGLMILAGTVEMGGNGVLYNTNIVASPQGLAGKYRKCHINELEIPYFSYGYDLPVFHHPKITFGIEICYDSHFPELSTALALKGCELLFFPHASGVDMSPSAGVIEEGFAEKRERWLRYMPARAYDNSLFVVVCNHVGDNGGRKVFPGVSMIIDPQGNVVTEAKAYEEDIIVADLRAENLLQVRKERGAGFFLHYRRPELYDMVVEKSP